MATLRLKVVPGARRDCIVGWYGDAIKIRVAAPPEQGKANAAVVALLAGALNVHPSDITIRHGHASAQKALEVAGLSQDALDQRLKIYLTPDAPT